MRDAQRQNYSAVLSVALFVLIALSGAGQAERLPIKTYTTADGLARDRVSRIVRDSRGFLWFCTSEGLSRFDGYRFTNYGLDQGLPGRLVTDLLESRSGDYWVATNEGLCRFILDPSQTPAPGASAAKKFVVYHPGEGRFARHINTIREDRSGAIWCGTEGGLYRFDQVDGQWLSSYVDIPETSAVPERLPGYLSVRAIIEDRRGALWVSADGSLFRLSPDRAVEAFTTKDGLPSRSISAALMEDRDGHIWVGSLDGLCRLVPDPQPGRNVVARAYTTKEGLANNAINALLQSLDGRIWVGTEGGLSEFLPAGKKDGTEFLGYTTANGLIEKVIQSVAEDRDGNLWLGTESGGAMKLAVFGFATYLEGDGLVDTRISSILEDRAGELCVVSSAFINRFDGRGFSGVPLTLPAGITRRTWGWYQHIFQDHTGEWWMSTGQGLARYPKLAKLEQLSRARPKAIYTTRDGLMGDLIFRIYEDSRGDIWIGTINYNQDGLTRWDRATETFHRYSPADRIPQGAPSAFCEDRSGNLWIGFYNGGLARYAKGKFTLFRVGDGVPEGTVRGLYVDSEGRLWIASSEGGAARVDDPNTTRPRFDTYTIVNGLSSNSANCVTEDQWGKIYIGTGRGVDRLDPTSGNIRHYTTADGLASNYINVSFRSRDGALWFGTLQGLSRLMPQPDRPTLPPPVLISALKIAGATYPIPELGATQIAGPELSASRNQVQIDFLALSLGAGETLRYQFKLEGGNQDWSAPSDQRTVNFPNLSPGDYRFIVRAVSADGTLSESPATVSFKILSPIWQRWWFLLLGAVSIAAMILLFERYRAGKVRVLKESEDRFRTLAQTASDAIITIDEQSVIIFVNPAAEQIFGHTVEEMLGRDLTMLMPEYLRHLHKAGLSRYAESNIRHIAWEAVELPGLHKDGREIPLELSFGEFMRNGKRFFTGVARDITERKRAEEALRKSREDRIVELEHVRRRIATDLHDDIGSSLSQIFLLSEVARQRIGRDDNSVEEPLSMIANASHELVGSMSDIVWAINPHKDQLSDLVQRMRRFASELLEARDIEFSFRAPDAEENIRLDASIRREVFLVFKEAVNNLAKHSGCRAADIEFRASHDSLTLKLSDDGHGFDATQESEGHGLVSMRERAKAIGGSFSLMSSTGHGTTVTLEVQLDQPASNSQVTPT